MKGFRSAGVVAVVVAVLAPSVVSAQRPPDPAVTAAAQREAMAQLSFMEGAWRGTAWTLLPSGEQHELTQTERMGPFLDGTVRVIEGRGYGADGEKEFNAFAVVSYDVRQGTFNMRSYAQGQVGDFVLTPTADGYEWEIPAGPMTIRYVAVVEDGTWFETGERLMPGREPVQIFEMRLQRVGDSDWPEAGAILPR